LLTFENYCFEGRLTFGDLFRDSGVVPGLASRGKGPSARSAPVPGFRVQGSGFRVQGSGFRVQSSGFRVQVLGFRVQGLGFRVQDARSRIQGSEFRI
jgi:hypothetical protein